MCNRIDLELLKRVSVQHLLWAVLFGAGQWQLSTANVLVAEVPAPAVSAVAVKRARGRAVTQRMTTFATSHGMLVHELRHAPLACLQQLLHTFDSVPAARTASLNYSLLLFVVRVCHRLLAFMEHPTVRGRHQSAGDSPGSGAGAGAGAGTGDGSGVGANADPAGEGTWMPTARETAAQQLARDLIASVLRKCAVCLEMVSIVRPQ